MIWGYHYFWKHPHRVVVTKICIFSQIFFLEMIQSDESIFFSKWVGEKPPTSKCFVVFYHGKTVDGSEIRRSPVDRVKRAHYLYIFLKYIPGGWPDRISSIQRTFSPCLSLFSFCHVTIPNLGNKHLPEQNEQWIWSNELATENTTWAPRLVKSYDLARKVDRFSYTKWSEGRNA